MTIYFVGAGPGDPELLTIKAYSLLRQARCCIYAGSLVQDSVLQLLPQDAITYNSATMDLDEIIRVMVQTDQQGMDVVRLHSGDPSLYGAIREQIALLKEQNIDLQVIPGISSFQAAAARLQVELTAPDVSQTVILTRVSGRTPLPEAQELRHLAQSRSTLCLFLSVHKIEEITNTLLPHYGEQCPAAVVYHVSQQDEKVVRGTLSNIAPSTRALGIKKSALIIVGHALGSEMHFSKLYDKNFSHQYRKAKSG